MKIPMCANDHPSLLSQDCDKINVHIRGLSAMDVCSEQYGSLLIPIIMRKLPSEIMLCIARESTDAVWKLEDLMGVVKVEVKAR